MIIIKVSILKIALKIDPLIGITGNLKEILSKQNGKSITEEI